MSQNKYPGYNPNEKNEICLVIADICFDDSKLPVRVKDAEDINKLFEVVNKLLNEHGFALDAYGNKTDMVDRFHDKLNK